MLLLLLENDQIKSHQECRQKLLWNKIYTRPIAIKNCDRYFVIRVVKIFCVCGFISPNRSSNENRLKKFVNLSKFFLLCPESAKKSQKLQKEIYARKDIFCLASEIAMKKYCRLAKRKTNSQLSSQVEKSTRQQSSKEAKAELLIFG